MFFVVIVFLKEKWGITTTVDVASVACLKKKRNAIVKNKEIDLILAEQRKSEHRELKLLLLGEMILSVLYQKCH